MLSAGAVTSITKRRTEPLACAMQRRDFIRLIGATALSIPRPGYAQTARNQLPSTPHKSASVSAKALKMLKAPTLRWVLVGGFSACFD
jgi:hypothetical protein